jgi:hypothetical protein
MALTPKQEAFCQAVASGKSYKDAYISAYDCTDTGRTALNEGSKLALRDDIQARITTLLKPVQKAAQVQGLNARQERIDFIMERIKRCEEKEDEQSLIRWNDQLCKILALYKDNEEKENTDNNLTNINTDLLAKIAKIG